MSALPTNDQAHQEKHFEAYIVQKLKEQGWLLGESKNYDTETALYPEDLQQWMIDSQPKAWDLLLETNKNDPAQALKTLTARLVKELEDDKKGMIQVLRRGISLARIGHVDLSESMPEDKRNEDVIKRYKANRLRVVPQLKYHPAREFAIDLVFFINGLPVATVEVKTDFTQSAAAAVDQYKKDRIPTDPKTKRKEPLLTFKRGAIVHFAMSDSDIQMATKLDGDNTFFLPFNKGNNGHAGNAPREDGEYPVAYFWDEICQPDAWLRIFHSFVYVEKKDVSDIYGNWKKKETLIFPRFHQWDAVNKMVADAKVNGPGLQYLCEHSAGSGKTSTIAWTAHDLTKLRHDDGKPVFDSVIIVTDRNVLDSQLQDAVQQIDHQFGLIAAIDREKSSQSKSVQLAKAMGNGTPIIVVTIQTFPFAMQEVVTNEALKDKSYAVIIDEAHTSQTGSSATKLQAALSMSSKGGTGSMTVEEILAKLQKSRVRPKNVSHFAFTATPKHATMMLFGRTKDGELATDDNLPESFHKYTMRQAIEEGFILDVLKGYVPYKTAFNLAKQLDDSKRVSGKAAKKALAQWMNLHPTNVTQKVEFIVEHFSKNVSHLLDGKAKAMVVTSSRAAAVRYKLALDKYIERNPQHAGIRSLIAFSGKLTGKEVKHIEDEGIKAEDFILDDDVEFSESSMNLDIQGQDLRLAFDRPEYRVMLVADKFQTGFDQPKLVAMYVDKKIANDVEIVQTYARLNRMAPGKDTVFIIDFVNDPETVRKAFLKYDEGAEIEEAQDYDVIYDIQGDLEEHRIYEPQDLENFKQARFRSIRDITQSKDPQHKALFAATDRPTRIFNERLKMLREAMYMAEDSFQKAKSRGDKAGEKSADLHRKEYADQLAHLMTFKNGLGRFCRTYSYIAQLVEFNEPELENFAAFAKLLQKRLMGLPPEDIDLKGLVLTGFDIKQKPDEGADDGEKPVLKPIGPGGQIKGGPGADYLKEIIDRLNRLFGEATPLKDQAVFVNHIASIAKESDVVMAQIENNTMDQALKGNLPGAVQQAVVRAMTSHSKLSTLMLKSDSQGMAALTGLIYEILKANNSIDIDSLND